MTRVKKPFILAEERSNFAPCRYYLCEFHGMMVTLGECQRCVYSSQEYKGTIVCDYTGENDEN